MRRREREGRGGRRRVVPHHHHHLRQLSFLDAKLVEGARARHEKRPPPPARKTVARAGLATLGRSRRTSFLFFFSFLPRQPRRPAAAPRVQRASALHCCCAIAPSTRALLAHPPPTDVGAAWRCLPACVVVDVVAAGADFFRASDAVPLRCLCFLFATRTSVPLRYYKSSSVRTGRHGLRETRRSSAVASLARRPFLRRIESGELPDRRLKKSSTASSST